MFARLRAWRAGLLLGSSPSNLGGYADWLPRTANPLMRSGRIFGGGPNPVDGTPAIVRYPQQYLPANKIIGIMRFGRYHARGTVHAPTESDVMTPVQPLVNPYGRIVVHRPRGLAQGTTRVRGGIVQ